MPLQTGQILNNRYRIVKLLGQGGFGAVYRAWDTSLNVPVALKENFDTSPASARQFALEANILAGTHHQSLPKVTDHFSLPGQGQYLVLEYIDGEDLTDKVIRNGALPESQALAWIGQILDALIYLHENNPPIIHRDIKPDNIRITPQGSAILVDFGIAKIGAPGERTLTGARAATQGYSPLESYGQNASDARSDIYSLGATLYCALTGQVPPDSIERATGTPLTPLRHINPSVSPQVEAAVLKAMGVQPQDRFSSARELKFALQAPSTAPVEHTQMVASRPQPPTPPVYSLPYQPPVASPAIGWEAKKPPVSWAQILLAGGLATVIFLAAIAYIASSLAPDPTATPVSTEAAVSATITPAPTQASTVTAAVIVALPPTHPPTPIRTLEEQSVPTSTRPPTEPPPPAGPMMLLLDTGYHCRGGPDITYETPLRDLNPGERLELIGRSPDGFWYLVRLKDPSTNKKLCWVSGGEVQGDPNLLPVCTWTGDGYTDNSTCSP